MLASMESLLEIDQKIRELEAERDRVAQELQCYSKEQDTLLGGLDNTGKLEEIAAQIESAKSHEDIGKLRAKHGDLELLVKVDGILLARQRDKELLRKIADVESISTQLEGIEDITYEDILKYHNKLKSLVDLESAEPALEKYNMLITNYAKCPKESFERELLAKRCDHAEFKFEETTVASLRRQFTELFQLSQLLLPEPAPSQRWSFISIANNFRIKFVYHFANPSFGSVKQTIQAYFNFLGKYLDDNLMKYIELFHDEENGIPRELIHQQFIYNILDPVREKIRSSLKPVPDASSEDAVKAMVILISQIFITDNALVKSHMYDGVGLVSLIPHDALLLWQDFEIDSANEQYAKLTANKASLPRNGVDLVKLLENMYRYLEPFFNIDYQEIIQIKFKLVDKIFIQLPLRYKSYLLSKESSAYDVAEEQQLTSTCQKLQNLYLLETTMVKFSHRITFIELTDMINKSTNSNYENFFDEVLEAYNDALFITRDSIIHRCVKKLSSTLRNYFKYNEWSYISAEPEQCTAEVVGAISFLENTIRNFEAYSFPQDILDYIKVDLVENVVNFILNYVVKLNKFSYYGLKQLMVDFNSLRSALRLPYGERFTKTEHMLLEYIKILEMKYSNDSKKKEILSKDYISRQQPDHFPELMLEYNIRHLAPEEIADAIFRAI